jgi:hypothetical protein
VIDSASVASCIVSYLDGEGLRHTVEVQGEKVCMKLQFWQYDSLSSTTANQ